ncbi:MAG: 50S ribosomal protein L30 [Myxococcales bacterium]|nr:50S ribosomal protein L30 [Myxococcales bacterium]
MTKIRVTLKRSTIGQSKRQRETVKGLGLRRINHTVVLRDTPAIRGMVTSVQHLLEVRVEAGEAELFGRKHQK